MFGFTRLRKAIILVPVESEQPQQLCFSKAIILEERVIFSCNLLIAFKVRNRLKSASSLYLIQQTDSIASIEEKARESTEIE